MNGARVELGSAKFKRQARPKPFLQCPNPSAVISVLQALLDLTTHAATPSPGDCRPSGIRPLPAQPLF